MQADNVDYLPIWKKDATASERLEELAMIARKHPERFERFIIGYMEVLPSKNQKVRFFNHNAPLLEGLGLIECLRDEFMAEARAK